ncbi:hypothetical protein D0810_15020 [Vibrio cholerae]|nr:hypothetical protein [Vibrio cholerae]EGR2283071.1 hypothetical protein [Vibrio cholerae]
MKLTEILNKDDWAMINICMDVLTATKFKQVKAQAMEKAALAASFEPELKKVNAARRAINQTFLSALKEAGIENWRELVRQQKERDRK